MESDSRHQCLIYDGPPSQQLSALAAVLRRRLNEGYRCLYLNSITMVAGLRSCLAATGMDVADEVAKGRLVFSTESNPFEGGIFDPDLMLQQLEGALDQALRDGYKGLWATGDMTFELGSEKNFAKLLEYEHKLENFFQKRQEMVGICQYHRDTLPSGTAAQALLTHRAVFINETLSRINPHFVSTGMADPRLAETAEVKELLNQIIQAQQAGA
jgi:hypothetical protein